MVRAAWVPYYRLFGDNRVAHRWQEDRRGTLASTVLDMGMGSSDTLGAMFRVNCQLDKLYLESARGWASGMSVWAYFDYIIKYINYIESNGRPALCGWHHSLVRMLNFVSGERESGAAACSLLLDCGHSSCFKLLLPWLHRHGRWCLKLWARTLSPLSFC